MLPSSEKGLDVWETVSKVFSSFTDWFSWLLNEWYESISLDEWEFVSFWFKELFSSVRSKDISVIRWSEIWIGMESEIKRKNDDEKNCLALNEIKLLKKIQDASLNKMLAT